MRQSDWALATDVWETFVNQHPELGYRPGRWQFHNFLRYHREALVQADVIRLARRRFWIAHRERFASGAFLCATAMRDVQSVSLRESKSRAVPRSSSVPAEQRV